MNQIAIRTITTFVSISVIIILVLAAVMVVSAQTEPERPIDLIATAIDHDTINLSWNHPNPASVDHYLILSRREGSGDGQLINVGTSITTSFEHSGLEPESTYVYRVKPVNANGEEGKRSARSEATTLAEEAPEPTLEPEPTVEPTPEPTHEPTT